MKKKAFTLVEILVVATIIALLASIAAVSYSQFIKQGRDARRKTDIEQIRAAIELYRNFNGAYPAPGVAPGMAFGTGSIADGSSTYMSKIPSDPMSIYTYYYLSFPSTGSVYQDYTLCAFMEGGGTTEATNTLCNSGSLECNYCMGPYGQK